MAKPAKDKRMAPEYVHEQPQNNIVMMTRVWAPAITCSVGLQAEEALGMADLDWHARQLSRLRKERPGLADERSLVRKRPAVGRAELVV